MIDNETKIVINITVTDETKEDGNNVIDKVISDR